MKLSSSMILDDNVSPGNYNTRGQKLTFPQIGLAQFVTVMVGTIMGVTMMVVTIMGMEILFRWYNLSGFPIIADS